MTFSVCIIGCCFSFNLCNQFESVSKIRINVVVLQRPAFFCCSPGPTSHLTDFEDFS